MCSRFTITKHVNAVAEFFGIDERPNLRPRYNVAPTQDVSVAAIGRDGARRLVTMHWGLVPSWAKEQSIGNRMINARSETVAEKPAFRSAFAKRPCLVPADGFYEWRKQADGTKQPFRITLPDEGLFAIAGLWEQWREREGDQPYLSFTILTRPADAYMAQLHDRMPVILTPEQHETWLSGGPDGRQAVIDAGPVTRLLATPVGRAVGNPRVDEPGLIEPVGAPLD